MNKRQRKKNILKPFLSFMIRVLKYLGKIHKLQ